VVDSPEPCELVPHCPICLIGAMRLAHRAKAIVICTCDHCGTTLSVPEQAFEEWTPPASG